MSALEQDAPRGFVTMREYLKLQAKCDALEEKLAWATPQRPHQTRAETAVPDMRVGADEVFWKLRGLLGVSPQESDMLRVLTGGRHTGLWLMKALRVNSPNAISVIICHLRHKCEVAGQPNLLAKLGSGNGFDLTDEGRAWLKERAPEAFQTQGASR